MGQPFLMQRWDTVQGGLPAAPGLEGKGRNTTIALVSPGGRRALRVDPRSKCREPESVQPEACLLQLRVQVQGWGGGGAAVLPASLSLSVRSQASCLGGAGCRLPRSVGFWTLLLVPAPVRQSQVGSHPSTPTSDGDA